MTTATLYCDKCEKEQIVEINNSSDLFYIVCPVCKSEKVWIRDTGLVADWEIELGRGGCSQK